MSASSEGLFGFRGGEGRIQQESPDKTIMPTPLPRDQIGWGWESRTRTWSPSCPPSHHRAALGLFLLEGGGEQVRLAGQVEESFGEAAGGAGLWEGLQLVDAGHRCGTKYAVNAFLRGEG